MASAATYTCDGTRVTQRQFADYLEAYGDALVAIHCDYLGEFGPSQTARAVALGAQRETVLGDEVLTVTVLGDESLRETVEELAGQRYRARGARAASPGFARAVADLCYLAALESMLRERDGVHTVEVLVKTATMSLDLVTLDVPERSVLVLA